MSATTPTASAAAQQPPVLRYGVGLEQAIENVHATIELAARQGLSQARIALHPQELGEIRIHLTQTSDGLVARVLADTPAAAQALAAGHAELRQSLSSLGLSLLHLDVGSFGQPDGQTRDGRTAGQQSSSANTNRALAGVEANELEPSDADSSQPTTSEPANGALVDVRV